MAKSAIAGRLGVTIDLKNIIGEVHDDEIALYSESQGRILVTVSPEHKEEFERLMRKSSFAHIGTVEDTSKIVINGIKGNTVVSVSLEKALESYKKTFKDY